MKKSTMFAAIASVMLLAAPQQAEAQFLKKLGKAIGDAAKETWDNAKKSAKNVQQSSTAQNVDTIPLITEEEISVTEPSSDSGPVLTEIAQTREKKVKAKGVEFSLRFVPHGKFVMGERDNTLKVELTNDYWVSETEVTQALWRAVMGETTTMRVPDRPMETTWIRATEFVKRLNIITGYNFRIITEAEWEYAARYGNGDKRFSGSNELSDVWNLGESVKASEPGGLNKPNYLGVYGMSNSIGEWCSDLVQERFPKGPIRNYSGPDEGLRAGGTLYRVVRAPGKVRMPRLAEVTFRTKELESSGQAGIRLALTYNDVKDNLPQQTEAIDKRKVNIPSYMIGQWEAGPNYDKVIIDISNERRHLDAVGNNIGYGYVATSKTGQNYKYYLITKIISAGTNAITVYLVPQEEGKEMTMTLTKHWDFLKSTSKEYTFNNQLFKRH